MVSETFTMDEELLSDFQLFCEHTGLTVSTAINIFAAQVVRAQKIPFEIVADPFYSPINMQRLSQAIKEVETGKVKMTEHELIEA